MTVPSIPQILTELKMTQDDQQPRKCSVYMWWVDSWRGIMAEFISTMMLVLFGCMACLPMEGINLTIYPPFGFGFVVLFNIQIFGHISGAYMNPAVTLATVIWGSKSLIIGILYIIAQCAGAVLGYGILVSLSPFDLEVDGVCVTMPYAGITDLQAVGVEAALTAALILINCGIWDPAHANKQDSTPIKFGLTIVGLSLVGGPLTGASMNPARTLGPAVWTGRWARHWVYWVGPTVGSFFSVLFYKKIFLKKYE